MCTECGTPVPFSKNLFGPWEGLWCGACIHPLGFTHRATYCASCNARIVDFNPASKKGMRHDEIVGRHKVKRRGRQPQRAAAFKDWYNMSARSYTVIDHLSCQKYTIHLCEPCNYTCDFNLVERWNGPYVLGSLMNALKNPKAVVASGRM